MGAGFAVVSGAVGTVAEHRKSDSLALGRLSRVAPSVDPPPGMREGVALLETLPAVSFQCPVPDTPYCRPYSSFRVARATVPTLLGDRGEATHTVCVFYIGGKHCGVASNCKKFTHRLRPPMLVFRAPPTSPFSRHRRSRFQD